MERKTVDKLIRDLETQGDLPTLPQIVLKLNSVAEDPKSAAADLANIILRDPSLTSRILRIANSMFYAGGSGRHVATVTQAVVVLGFRSVVQLALSITVLNLFGASGRDHQLLRVWIHSIACAVACQSLARVTRMPNLEEAFVAGLIHDLGHLILMRHAPQAHQRILERIEKGEDPLTAEQRELGFTHAEIGEALARRWSLPGELAQAIGAHHRPGASADPLLNIVAIGNQIAAAFYAVHPQAQPPAMGEIERLARTHLQVGPDALGVLWQSLRAGVDECLQIFGLDEAREGRRAAQLGVGSPAPGSERMHELFVKMEADIHRKNAQISLLQQISHAMIQSADCESLLPMILEGLYVSLQLERLGLALVRGAGLHAEVGFGADIGEVLPRLTLAGPLSDDHPLGDVLKSAQPLNVLDGRLPVYAPLLGKWSWPAQAFAVAPVFRGGRPCGLLVADRGAAPISDDDLEMIALFANQISLALERKAAGPGR